MPGSGAIYRSGPSPRGSGPLCSTMPAVGYGQGRWLGAFPIAGGPQSDKPDDRPVHLPLRAKARVNLARREAECPLTPRAARNRTVTTPEEFRAPKAYESLGGTNPRT